MLTRIRRFILRELAGPILLIALAVVAIRRRSKARRAVRRVTSGELFLAPLNARASEEVGRILEGA